LLLHHQHIQELCLLLLLGCQLQLLQVLWLQLLLLLLLDLDGLCIPGGAVGLQCIQDIQGLLLCML
jgi:hypothetical protein